MRDDEDDGDSVIQHGPSATLTPAIMSSSIDSSNPAILDKYGRPHVPQLCNGKLYCFLRSHLFNKVTARTHCDDLSQVLKEEMQLNPQKKHLMMCTDGGGDYTNSVNTNLYFLWQLFKILEFESLSAYQFASGLSAHNSIEHVWAKLNERMVGAYLPDCLPTQNKPPLQCHTIPSCSDACQIFRKETIAKLVQDAKTDYRKKLASKKRIGCIPACSEIRTAAINALEQDQKQQPQGTSCHALDSCG